MKLPILLASLAALGFALSRVLATDKRTARPTLTLDEPSLTARKKAAFASAPADAEQRLRQRYDGMVTR